MPTCPIHLPTFTNFMNMHGLNCDSFAFFVVYINYNCIFVLSKGGMSTLKILIVNNSYHIRQNRLSVKRSEFLKLV